METTQKVNQSAQTITKKEETLFSPESAPKKSKLIFILLGFFLILLIVASASLVSKSLKEQTFTPQPSTVPKTTPTHSLNTVDNWKVFHNSSLSFSYPNSWTDAQENMQSYRTEVVVMDGTETEHQSVARLDIISGGYYNQDLQRMTTFDEFLKNNPSFLHEDLKISDYHLGDLNGKCYSYHVHGVGYYQTDIYLADSPKSSYFVQIHYRHGDNESLPSSHNPIILDQILSTFKFIN